MTKAVTPTAIEAAKPPKKGRIAKPDGLVPGMQFIVHAGGKKSFRLRARIHGKQVNLEIGDASLMTLADARKKAKGILLAIDNGEDPRTTKHEAIRAAAETVAVVARDYIETYAKVHTRRWRDLERQIEGEVIARWGTRPIASITKRDLPDLTAPIIKRGAFAMANRVFETARRIFNWAADQGLIENSPFARRKKPAPKLPTRERVLSDSELTLIWQAAAALGYPAGSIIHLLILTAARRSEIADMRWGELSPDMATWVLPRERSKNKLAHELSLPASARSILAALPRINQSPFVFTLTGERPFDSFKIVNNAINRMIVDLDDKALPPWVIHDIRRSVATGLGRLEVLPHVIERILNHAVPKIEKTYQRHDYRPEKAEALERWARHVETLVAGSSETIEEMSMAKKVKRLLTVDSIRKLDIGTNSQRRLVRDYGAPGLYLAIEDSGLKCWILLRPSGKAGRNSRTTLGPVDLTDAVCTDPVLGMPLSPQAARALVHRMMSAPKSMVA